MVSLPPCGLWWVVGGVVEEGVEGRRVVEGKVEDVGADMLGVRLDYWSRSFLFRRCRRGRGSCAEKGKMGRGKLRVGTQ